MGPQSQVQMRFKEVPAPSSSRPSSRCTIMPKRLSHRAYIRLCKQAYLLNVAIRSTSNKTQFTSRPPRHSTPWQAQLAMATTSRDRLLVRMLAGVLPLRAAISSTIWPCPCREAIRDRLHSEEIYSNNKLSSRAKHTLSTWLRV